jgi:hypothetical protein
MWDSNRVFALMHEMRTERREDYRKLSLEDVTDRLIADFLVATMKIDRETKKAMN